MNIQLAATALTATNTIDKMQLIKVRGCNRNEDCVYFDDAHFLVYKISGASKNNKTNFVIDLVNLFRSHFSETDAEKIYDFIQKNHSKIFAKDEKNVKKYAKTSGEEIALSVLRQDPYCDIKKFKELAFDFAINNNYSRIALKEAINCFAMI